MGAGATEHLRTLGRTRGKRQSMWVVEFLRQEGGTGSEYFCRQSTYLSPPEASELGCRNCGPIELFFPTTAPLRHSEALEPPPTCSHLCHLIVYFVIVTVVLGASCLSIRSWTREPECPYVVVGWLPAQGRQSDQSHPLMRQTGTHSNGRIGSSSWSVDLTSRL